MASHNCIFDIPSVALSSHLRMEGQPKATLESADGQSWWLNFDAHHQGIVLIRQFRAKNPQKVSVSPVEVEIRNRNTLIFSITLDKELYVVEMPYDPGEITWKSDGLRYIFRIAEMAEIT